MGIGKRAQNQKTKHHYDASFNNSYVDLVNHQWLLNRITHVMDNPTTHFFLSSCVCFVYLPHVPNEVTEQEDVYRSTSNRVGMEWLLSPLMGYQNYHLAHHLYPDIPFYRMVKVWNSRLDEHLSHDPATVPL